jgi:hypothetical protein
VIQEKIQGTIQLPSREILATLRYRRVEITEDVGIDAVLFLISRWNQVNTTQRFVLITSSRHWRGPEALAATYNLGILVFLEDVQGGTQSATQNGRIL